MFDLLAIKRYHKKIYIKKTFKIFIIKKLINMK